MWLKASHIRLYIKSDKPSGKKKTKKMLFSNSKELLPGRTEHVEIPEPAAPVGPWLPSYLHGRSGPGDLYTIQKLLVIWAGVLIFYMHLFTCKSVNNFNFIATFQAIEIINLIKIQLQSIKRFVKTHHRPELWWVLLNHPGNIEAVVKLQRTNDKGLF